MAYCTGRIPALHFYERRLLAYLQLCAKSTLDPVWASSLLYCVRHVLRTDTSFRIENKPM